MRFKYTEADKKILSELQRDCTANTGDLADRLGMSQSTLWRRVNDLESAGVIKKRVALLDSEKLGISICIFVNINLKSHTTKDREAFQKFVIDMPETMECFSVTGAHDYTLIIRTDTVARFEMLLMNQILTHPSVASASSQIALRQHKYSTELPI